MWFYIEAQMDCLIVFTSLIDCIVPCSEIANKVSKFEMLAVGSSSNSSSMDLGRDSPPKNLWFYKVSYAPAHYLSLALSRIKFPVSRSLWSRNYLRSGAGAEIIFLINIYCSQFGAVLRSRSRYFLVGAGAGVKIWSQKPFFYYF